MPTSSKHSSSGGECIIHCFLCNDALVCNWISLKTYEMLIVSPLPPSTKHADSIDLELEVDPLNVDHFSCTPLVRELRTTALIHSVKGKFSPFLFVSFGSVFFHPDVGVCTGSPGGSSDLIQMGQTGSGHPRFPGTPSPFDCSISWPYQTRRMSRTTSEGRTAAPSSFAPHTSHVLLPSP